MGLDRQFGRPRARRLLRLREVPRGPRRPVCDAGSHGAARRRATSIVGDPELVAVVRDVRGDTITAALTAEAVPGLTFSKGHGYQVGQVGAFVRIPLGLVDLYAIVVQVGAAPAGGSDDPDDRVAWAAPGTAWMRLELFAEGSRDAAPRRGVSRYPAIGDAVYLVTADDLGLLYGTADQDASTHVRVGHVANAPHLPATLDVNALVSRHSAVVGSTGTGKSSTVSALLHQLADQARYPSGRIVVVDVHGEYAGGLGGLAHVRRVRIGTPTAQGPSPMFLPYWALTVDELVSLTFGALDETSHSAVRDWLLERKREHADRHPELGLSAADVTADTPLPFSVHRLWFDFHERIHATHTAQQDAQSPSTRAYALDEDGEPLRGDARRVVAPTYRPLNNSGADRVLLSAGALPMRRPLERLAGLLRDPRYSFLFDPGPWAPDLEGEAAADLGTFLQDWLGSSSSVVVADVSNVPTAVLRDVVGVLLRVLYDALVWGRDHSAGGRERPLLVVLEEAHRYLGEQGGAAGEIAERIVKEGRKYGVGLMLVSQRPSEIRPTILSQVGTFVVLRLTNPSDRSLVRATLPDHLGGLFDIVPVLRTGEVVMAGEATRLPSRAVVDIRPENRPDSADPCVVSPDAARGWNAPDPSTDYAALVAAWRRSGAAPQETIHG